MYISQIRHLGRILLSSLLNQTFLCDISQRVTAEGLMKFTNYSFIFVFLFCFALLCCSTPQEETEVAETTQLSDEDITAINKTVQGYIQACLDGNWDLAVSYFTEDAIRISLNRSNMYLKKNTAIYTILHTLYIVFNFCLSTFKIVLSKEFF
jgi:hypothetical protein